MSAPLYIALCLIVPVLWGIAAAHVFDWFAERRKRRDTPLQSPPIVDSGDMYEI
jgi:hypothetical protein